MALDGFAEASQGLADDLRAGREGDAVLAQAHEAIEADEALDAAPDFDGALVEAGVLDEPDPFEDFDPRDGGIDWLEEAQRAAEGQISAFDHLHPDDQSQVAQALMEGEDPNELFAEYDDREEEPEETDEPDFSVGDADELQSAGTLDWDEVRPETYDALLAEFEGDEDAAREHFESTTELLADMFQEHGPEVAAQAEEFIREVGPALWEQVSELAEEIEDDALASGLSEDEAAQFSAVFSDAAFASQNVEGALAYFEDYAEARNRATEAEARENPHFDIGDSDRTSGPNGIAQLSRQTAGRVADGDPSATLRAEIMGFTRTHADLARQKAAAPPTVT